MIEKILTAVALILFAASLCVEGSPRPGDGMWHSMPVVAMPAPPQGSNGPCYDNEDNEVRCPDGKYHDHTGKPQPDKCANFGTSDADQKDCACMRAMTCKHDAAPGDKCGTYCRDKACTCTKDCS